jgi:hypothetical protein
MAANLAQNMQEVEIQRSRSGCRPLSSGSSIEVLITLTRCPLSLRQAYTA